MFSRDERINACCNELSEKLDELNNQKIGEVGNHINTAINNYVANARYRYVDPHGPCLGYVTEKEPLMHR